MVAAEISSDATISTNAGGFSLARALALHDDPIQGLLPIFVTISVWMFVSYAIAYASASIVATIMLRKHAWKFAIATPMAVMALLGPATLGAVTSLLIAWTLSQTEKSLSSWQCLLIGCAQTAFVLCSSFSRILATL